MIEGDLLRLLLVGPLLESMFTSPSSSESIGITEGALEGGSDTEVGATLATGPAGLLLLSGVVMVEKAPLV